jgi:hypothetical protein
VPRWTTPFPHYTAYLISRSSPLLHKRQSHYDAAKQPIVQIRSFAATEAAVFIDVYVYNYARNVLERAQKLCQSGGIIDLNPRISAEHSKAMSHVSPLEKHFHSREELEKSVVFGVAQPLPSFRNSSC